MSDSAAKLQPSWLDRIPTWGTMRRLGTSRVLKSSYYWLVLVPLAAKLSEALPKSIPVQGVPIPLQFDLPFAWHVFYFAAVSFAGASFVFSLRCPAIISRNIDSAEFFERGGRSSELKNLIRPNLGDIPSCPEFQITGETTQARKNQFFMVLAHAAGFNYAEVIKAYGKTNAFNRMGFNDNSVHDGFSDAVAVIERRTPKSRLICATLYAVGFALLFYILMQNLYFVCISFANRFQE